MFKFCAILLVHLSALQAMNLAMNPQAGAYNSFWDGAVGGQGYFGNLPSKKGNVFDSKWNVKDYNQMYNLNSQAPFNGDRFTGFDTMVPYYSPHGASRYTYYPTKSNFLSNNELGAFSYDINEPRYQELYKQYYRFFNKNLNRIQSQLKYQDKSIDLNNDQQRRILNPDSFKYDNYFDGFDESNTLPGAGLAFFSHKQSGRKLNLLKVSKKMRESTNGERVSKDEKTQSVVHLLERRVDDMRKLIDQLDTKPVVAKRKAAARKLKFIVVDPKKLSKVDLKPYLFDSLSPHSLKSDFNKA